MQLPQLEEGQVRLSTVTFYPAHWHNTPDNLMMVHSHMMARSCLKRRVDLHTTQMCLLSDADAKEYDLISIQAYDFWGDLADRVDIVNNHDGTYSCDRTERTLRNAHNFFKMWENGVFDD